jgi:hypothetical protein
MLQKITRQKMTSTDAEGESQCRIGKPAPAGFDLKSSFSLAEAKRSR